MASWIDEEIGTWDPKGGSGTGASCVGCFGGVVIGGTLFIMAASILEKVWDFLRGLDLKFTLPEFTNWDWAEVLAEFPNIMMSIFQFIGDILYNIAQFIYSFMG